MSLCTSMLDRTRSWVPNTMGATKLQLNVGLSLLEVSGPGDRSNPVVPGPIVPYLVPGSSLFCEHTGLQSNYVLCYLVPVVTTVASYLD